MAHITHTAIKGTKLYSNTKPSHPVKFSFYGWVNQSPHDNIAAPEALNLWPFSYQSPTLTNCAIIARHTIIIVLSRCNVNIVDYIINLMVINDYFHDYFYIQCYVMPKHQYYYYNCYYDKLEKIMFNTWFYSHLYVDQLVAFVST